MKKLKEAVRDEPGAEGDGGGAVDRGQPVGVTYVTARRYSRDYAKALKGFPGTLVRDRCSECPKAVVYAQSTAVAIKEGREGGIDMRIICDRCAEIVVPDEAPRIVTAGQVKELEKLERMAAQSRRRN